jgi:pimeloyl-ACP methyl ester carboxylesterase
MSRSKRSLGALAAVAAGAAAGVVIEELINRRAFRGPDPDAAEPIGSLAGESLWVESFDATRIHVRAYGPVDAQRTLVLAHGAIESHVIWHYQVRDLLADGNYRVIAYDARGHGRSGPARGPQANTPFTAYTMARDIVAVVQQATQGRVVLCGHSMGGMAIQGLWQHGEIVHIADRVAGIVLLNTAYTTDLRGWRGKGSLGERVFERVEDVLQRIPAPPKLIDRVRMGTNDLTLLIGRFVYGKQPSRRQVATSVRMYETTPSATLHAFIDLARFDSHDALSTIDVPTLVIGGSRDRVTPVWLSEEIAKCVPDVELVVFEDCGHTAVFERHEEVSAHLKKFAERVLS